jgi:guanine nucleotide-binding protein subunit alpha
VYSIVGYLQILFLNKEDLFNKKIAESPIRRFFPDYEGADDDVEAGKLYFQKRFLKIEYKGSSQLQRAASRQPPSKSHSAKLVRHVYPQ